MKKPITVLFNTFPVAFDCPGGGEVQLLKYEQYLKALGVKVIRYDTWNPHPQFDQADIVHYFSVQGGSGRFLHHVKHVRNIPLVLSPIIWIDIPEKYGLSEIKSILSFADHILPNSKAECDQLTQIFGIPSELQTPIVNGVDELFFEPIDPNIFRKTFDLKDPFVLCLGNIEERKNQLRLIQAVSGSGLYLVLAGHVREAEYAIKCRSAADSKVLFVGSLEHGSQLQRSAYAAADVFCLPSTLETPGLAALEAAAAGTRLVLTGIGCTQEYFGKFAVYLDPYDSYSIKQAIDNALLVPKFSELPKLVRQRYTWKKAAASLHQVYERILSDKRRHLN
jgi:glycosyltransferase involved in cell wall biosynthesis